MIYQFVVNFIGEVPEQFEFVYTILTTILALMFFGTFTSLFYWVLHLVKGAR